MAFSKSRLYAKDDQLLATYFRALGHPARDLILRSLSDGKQKCVEELQTLHPISQPGMSHHLKILRVAELVKYEERFPKTFYWVDRKRLKKVRKLLRMFFDELMPE